MSFILDALRKSETERQRQNGPGLVDAGMRPPAKRRHWLLPAFVAVVLVNAAVLAWLFLRPAGGPATQPPAPAPVAATAPALTDPARSLADAAGVAPPEGEAFDAAADLPALDGAEPVVEELPPAQEDPATAATPPPAGSGSVRDSLPTAQQLMDEGALPQQTLHIDLHVWDSNPAERFVFINMRRLTEGSELPEGGRVEEITPEGVVIDREGRRFVLPRD